MRVRHRIVELLAGGLVLLVLFSGFLWMCIWGGQNISGGNSYPLSALFNRVDGIQKGSLVRIGGVKVGEVTDVTIDPETFQAIVHFHISRNFQLPQDTLVQILSDGFFGQKFLSIAPGNSARHIQFGGRIQQTQSAVSLEELIGQFLFNSSSSSNGGKSS